MSKNLTDTQLAVAGVGVQHHFGGNAYIKETFIPKGAALTQHAHAHDHLAYLVAGEALVQRGDEAFTVSAPRGFLFDKDVEHGVTALTDVLWLCVWSTTCTDPEKVDDALEAGQ